MMRIATGIISILLSIFIGIQSCAVYVGGSLGSHKGLADSGALGIFVALHFMIGGAFAFQLPKVSMIIFAFSALWAYAAASGSSFSDMYIWGFVSIGLATMSYFAVKQSKKQSAVPAQPSVVAQPPSGQEDAAGKLEELRKMLDSNLITQDEYDRKKSEILSKIS